MNRWAAAPQHFETRVRERMAEGLSLKEAVRKTAALNPGLTWETLDVVGSWPSSDPVLAELQRQT